jgi:hypothetical protein
MSKRLSPHIGSPTERVRRPLGTDARLAAKRQGKNARQLLESVALETGDEGIAVSVVTVLELADGNTRADCPSPRVKSHTAVVTLRTQTVSMSLEKAAPFLSGAPKRRVLGNAFKQSGLLTRIRFVGVQFAGRTRYSRIVHQISAHVLVGDRFFGFYVQFHHIDHH